MIRKILLRTAALAAALVLVASSAVTASAQSGRTALNVDDNGVMASGFDVVAYQMQQRAMQGSAEYTATHEGAIYRFASAANRDAFRAEPAKFAPAFGGYCAMGVAVDKKLPVDPQAFAVVEGRLYLNVNREVQGMWARDTRGNVAKAQQNWGRVSMRRGYDSM